MLASTVTTSPVAMLTSDATTYAQLFARLARKPSSTFLPLSSSNGSLNHTFGGWTSGTGVPSGGGVNTPEGIEMTCVSFSFAGAIDANTMPRSASATNASVIGVAAAPAGFGWFGAMP